jgi:hypothetical protein
LETTQSRSCPPTESREADTRRSSGREEPASIGMEIQRDTRILVLPVRYDLQANRAGTSVITRKPDPFIWHTSALAAMPSHIP